MVNTRGGKPEENTELLSDLKKSVLQIFKSKEFLEEIAGIVTAAVSSAFGDRIKKLETDNEGLRRKVTRLESTVQKQNLALENVSQTSKLDSLCFFGIKDNKQEVTAKVITRILLEKYGDVLKVENVCSAYRMGKFREGSARPILVQFDSLYVRNRVYKNKSTFKGTDIVVRENLTAERLRIVKGAVQRYGAKCVWTSLGIVYVKDGGRIRRLAVENLEEDQDGGASV